MTRHIEVPCTVADGQAFRAYLAADGTMTRDAPAGRGLSWLSGFVVGGAAGMVAFVVIVVAGLGVVRYRRRAYFS